MSSYPDRRIFNELPCYQRGYSGDGNTTPHTPRYYEGGGWCCAMHRDGKDYEFDDKNFQYRVVTPALPMAIYFCPMTDDEFICGHCKARIEKTQSHTDEQCVRCKKEQERLDLSDKNF